MADARPVDVEHSTLTVYIFKAGLFAVFADNHVVRAPIAEGHVSDVTALAVDVIVRTTEMKVVDPALAADKRAEVQTRMLGPEVLDSARYPDIRFASTRVDMDGAGAWRVTGDLTLHGVSRPLTFAVTRREGHYRGAVSIRQRDYGIQPISIAGAVKVKDELRVEFDIVERRAAASERSAGPGASEEYSSGREGPGVVTLTAGDAMNGTATDSRTGPPCQMRHPRVAW